MDFYSTKIDLIQLASKLFTYKPIKLTKSVDLKGKFDHVDVHGAVSLSPNQQFELSSLNYNRDEQGRDYFSSFLTLVIQCGVKLGYEQKEIEIKDLKDRLKDSDVYIKSYRDELTKARNDLKINLMPVGGLEDEIRDLRIQLSEKDAVIKELQTFKNKINDINKIINRTY